MTRPNPTLEWSQMKIEQSIEISIGERVQYSYKARQAYIPFLGGTQVFHHSGSRVIEANINRSYSHTPNNTSGMRFDVGEDDLPPQKPDLSAATYCLDLLDR